MQRRDKVSHEILFQGLISSLYVARAGSVGSKSRNLGCPSAASQVGKWQRFVTAENVGFLGPASQARRHVEPSLHSAEPTRFELRLGPRSSNKALMVRKLGKCLVVVALVMATGGHWALLQTVAWVGMAIQFSQTDDFSTAIQKTLDGKHPCKICKVVEDGRKSTPQQEMQKVQTKPDFFCGAKVVFAMPTLDYPIVNFSPSLMLPRTEAPPLPPPRFA